MRAIQWLRRDFTVISAARAPRCRRVNGAYRVFAKGGREDTGMDAIAWIKKGVALGGICADNIPEVKSFGFGGVALLGDVWNRKGAEFIPHFHQLLQIIQS